ncbi:fatty acyl-AMP ligase [Pseudomonas syringae]|uniref:fatty acyl-AMP ligase n=1 Tax=Pseudomonas syringae TaxID=317 RepID=UPI002248C768|nr:fatty acyl-AMP ligase [Pseudomonas syringae]UZS66443.1 fatty acyl-AMP ligase [Pseudomonas syringae]
MQNLSEIICWRAQEQPEKIAYRFFQGSAQAPVELTFRGVYEKAASLAARLQQMDLLGERVLLSCKSQQFFVIGFFGCLLAGCIVVPAPPPRRKAFTSRMDLLANNADARGAIYDVDQPGIDDKLLLIDMRVWEAAESHASNLPLMPVIHEDSIAFLQYTSGSTSDPKGVVVTHGNLMHNCAVIQDGMKVSSASSILTALPLFHDMGLVGGVLESMFTGCVSNIMSPAEFVQFPERWLRVISDFNVTISGGPNFMYELAARAVNAEQLAGCDLSAWQVAFCGAEPIRTVTIEHFTRKMAAFGFKSQAFYPCYGMAESTLFITGKTIDSSPEVCTYHGGAVVGCGVPRLGTQVKIVDPSSRVALSELEIGEIWVDGGSVAAGYWRAPELTAQVFGVQIEGESNGAYLRTGDLGYIKNRELFVTGRLKDQIIVYGKKYAPHDIEAQAQASHEALREAGGAAFVLNEGSGNRLLLVFELKREWLRRVSEWPAVSKAMCQAVNAVHGVAIDEIVLIKPGSLPRTSSGKVRRNQCRLDYLAGTLDILT